MTNNRQLFFRIFRFLLGLSITIFLGFMLLRSFIVISSKQAVINAEITSLRSPIPGNVYIDQRSIKPGNSFSKHQAVFQVENQRFGNLESVAQYNYLQSLIETVENEIIQKSISSKKYESDYQRFQNLQTIGGVSTRNFEDVENTLAVLKATIETKKKQLTQLQKRLAKTQHQIELQKECTVTMPFDGIIWALSARNREYIQVNDEVIQAIDPERIWVDAFFHEKHATKLRPGDTVTVRLIASQKKWKGKILFIRAGIGRVIYNAPVAIPPPVIKKRLVAVRIEVDWNEYFTPAEFYGVGYSVMVTLRNNRHTQKKKK